MKTPPKRRASLARADADSQPVPYWNDEAALNSASSWTPPDEKAFAAPGERNGWFSEKSVAADVPNRTSALAADERRDKRRSFTVRKARMIRAYPNAKQRAEIKRWRGAARWFYNKTVETLTSGDDPPVANKIDIRNRTLAEAPEWAKGVPREVKAGAVFDACRAVSAVKINNAGKTKDDEGFAEAGFRSRKAPKQSFTVQANCYSNDGVYTGKIGSMRLAERVPDTEGKRSIARFVLRNGRYFLHVPYEETARPSLGENQAGMVALDLGVRTFASYYADDGAGKIGDGDFGRIQRLCSHLDRLLSRIALRRKAGASVRSMRRAADRLRWKIRNLVDELHWQVVNDLTRRYAVIVVGDLQTKRLAEKSKRKLRRKSVRAMLTWSHGRFRERLLQKAAERGVRVIVVNEAYTSKTCSLCGWVKENLGGAKAWSCKGCGVRHDRDINGARGIFLRALGDTPVLDSFEDAPV